MSLLGKLIGTEKKAQVSETPEEDPRKTDNRPCNVSGHDFQPKRSPHYHSNGVPHFSRDNYFKVTKHIPEECSKCDKCRKCEMVLINNDNQRLFFRVFSLKVKK